MSKIVVGIRHGEAWHNILFDSLGQHAFTDYNDTTLTAKGMNQASRSGGHDIQPELVLVSPLMRTLQTADILYKNVPKIALECLKEYPQHTELCNRRSPKSLLVKLYPNVDFTDLKTEEQMWPNHTPENDMKTIQAFIEQQEARVIAIVSHSTWLKFCINGTITSEPELEHCHLYYLNRFN